MVSLSPVAGAAVAGRDACFTEFIRPARFDAACGCVCYAVRLLPVAVGGCAVQHGGINTPVAGIPVAGMSIERFAYSDAELWAADSEQLVTSGGNLVQVPGIVSKGYSYSATAFGGDEPTSGGAENVGSIDLRNCGAHDEWLDLFFDGRPVEIYAGDCCDRSVDGYELIFAGTAKQLRWTSSYITIPFGDRRTKATQVKTVEVYDGSGGYHGDANVVGKPRPHLYGSVFNVTPVLIDSALQLYQLGKDLIEVGAVRDRGIELINQGDSADILNETVAPGHYLANLALGLIKLGSPPDGAITADATGQGTTTADIIVRALTSAFGGASLSADDFDQYTVSQLNNSAPWAVGYFIDVEITMAKLADELMRGIGGFWYFTRVGKFAFGLPWAADNTSCVNIDDSEIVGPWTHEPAGRPSYERRINYRKNWTKQTDIAAGSDAASRAYYQGTGLIARQAAPNHSATGQSVTTDSFLVDETAAQDLAAAMIKHYATRRDIYQIEVACGLLKFQLGDCVKIEANRFGQNQGAQFQVIGIDESASKPTARIRIARVS